MIRIGFVSDVHGDAEALATALAALQAHGCRHVWCAGNLVHYGYDADAVIRLLETHGVTTIRGNHDRWALEQKAMGDTSYRLEQESWRYLQSLPASAARTFWGSRVAMFHGSPAGDMDALYAGHLDVERAAALLDRTAADVLVVGHTRLPTVIRVGERLIANPGAVGRHAEVVARRPVTGGSYGVLEVPRRRFRIFDLQGRDRTDSF